MSRIKLNFISILNFQFHSSSTLVNFSHSSSATVEQRKYFFFAKASSFSPSCDGEKRAPASENGRNKNTAKIIFPWQKFSRFQLFQFRKNACQVSPFSFIENTENENAHQHWLYIDFSFSFFLNEQIFPWSSSWIVVAWKCYCNLWSGKGKSSFV